jgi:hypothetical protein
MPSATSSSSVKQLNDLKQELRARAELNRQRQKQLHAEQRKLEQEVASSHKVLQRKVDVVEKQVIAAAAHTTSTQSKPKAKAKAAKPPAAKKKQ